MFSVLRCSFSRGTWRTSLDIGGHAPVGRAVLTYTASEQRTKRGAAPMRIDRRQALGMLGAGGRGRAAPPPPPMPIPQFMWGVASGDPLTDRVILWTACGSLGEAAWEVARDAGFRRIVRRGVAEVTRARGFTVKIDVTGLRPGT